MRLFNTIWFAGRYFLSVAIFVSILFNPASALTSHQLTDNNIGQSVREELSFDQAVESSGITISVRDGIISLSGIVDNLLARDRAEAIAETVKGVRSVINRIHVIPRYPISDEVLSKRIKSALRADSATELYQLKIEVKKGKVKMSGLVDSFREKALAQRVVKGVSGVRQIENSVSVAIVPHRADADIQKDIEQSLKWDVLIDHERVKVAVKNGEVKLSGFVGSASEKKRAAFLSRIDGVKKVDIKNLKVEGWTRDNRLRKTTISKKPL